MMYYVTIIRQHRHRVKGFWQVRIPLLEDLSHMIETGSRITDQPQALNAWQCFVPWPHLPSVAALPQARSLQEGNAC